MLACKPSDDPMNDKQIPLRTFLKDSPIIPAVRKEEHLPQAIAAHGKIVYFLTGDPESCDSMIAKVVAAGKLPFLNLDLLNGFSRDKYAVNYLEHCGARGIISTHLEPLRHAHARGLFAIQRTFMLDSGALDTMTNQLKNTSVDALEVLPAMAAPKVLERVKSIAPHVVTVAGGLIRTLKEVEELIAQGICAVSISDPNMWLV
jgi:glycerol uptake operon antiterminator